MNKLVIFYREDQIIIDFAVLKASWGRLPVKYKQKKNQICKKHKIEKNCVRGYGAMA